MMRSLSILCILAAMILIIVAIDTRLDDLEDRQPVKAKVFKDGSARVMIGNVVCGLPPADNNIAYARCHRKAR